MKLIKQTFVLTVDKDIVASEDIEFIVPTDLPDEKIGDIIQSKLASWKDVHCTAICGTGFESEPKSEDQTEPETVVVNKIIDDDRKQYKNQLLSTVIENNRLLDEARQMKKIISIEWGEYYYSEGKRYLATLSTCKEIHITKRNGKFMFGFSGYGQIPVFISGHGYETLESAKKAAIKYLIDQLQIELKELTLES